MAATMYVYFLLLQEQRFAFEGHIGGSMSNRILFETRPSADAETCNRTSCDWHSAMRIRRNQGSLFLFVLLQVAVFLASVQFAAGQVSVLTWHYDNQRSSVNQSETLLTPANVNTKSFAKLYTQP